EGRCDCAHPLQIGRSLDLQTFLLVGAMVAFDKRIEVWPSRRTNAHLDHKAQPEAQERRGTLALMALSHKAWVAVDRDHVRQPLVCDNRSGSLDGAGHGKITPRLSRDQDGGAHIDDIENLDHVLLLALWLRRNSRGILKVQLPTLQGFGTFDTLMGTAPRRDNPLILTQN